MAPLHLNIIVVGAGIAGLGAAIVLSKAGHNVTIVEKSQFKKESGFMIILGRNALSVLESFDFDFKKARGSDSNSIRAFDGTTLEPSSTQDVPTPVIHNTQKTFYRPDLHSELKRIALFPSNPSTPVPILLLGQVVTNVDIYTGIVTLQSGKELKGDLVIGADGERSIMKKAMEIPESLKEAKYRVFRTLVPSESLMGDGGEGMLERTRGVFNMFLEGKRALFWFEGRDGLLQDLEAGYVPDDDESALEADPKKAKEKMLEIFGDYHPNIVDALQKAEVVSEWKVNYFSRPHPFLAKGKALIIGDAAHSMFPTTGQGGATTLEDIGALSLLFSSNPTTSPFPITSKSQIPARLKMFEKIRNERIRVAMAMSGCIFGKEEQFLRGRRWLEGGLRTAEEHVKFSFEYDVFEDARRVLREEKVKEEGNGNKARL